MYRRKMGQQLDEFVNLEVEKYFSNVDFKKMEPPMFMERIKKA